MFLSQNHHRKLETLSNVLEKIKPVSYMSFVILLDEVQQPEVHFGPNSGTNASDDYPVDSTGITGWSGSRIVQMVQELLQAMACSPSVLADPF